jgi:cytochrome c oxidase subunit IV
MSEHDHHDIDKHVRSYLMVFGALMVLTIVTVGISYLHLSTGIAVALALVVACLKGALVAAVFMHLSSEKRLIYAVLVATVVFFLFVLVIPVITELDEITVG